MNSHFVKLFTGYHGCHMNIVTQSYTFLLSHAHLWTQPICDFILFSSLSICFGQIPRNVVTLLKGFSLTQVTYEWHWAKILVTCFNVLFPCRGHMKVRINFLFLFFCIVFLVYFLILVEEVHYLDVFSKFSSPNSGENASCIGMEPTSHMWLWSFQWYSLECWSGIPMCNLNRW